MDKISSSQSFNSWYPNQGLSETIPDIEETIPDGEERTHYGENTVDGINGHKETVANKGIILGAFILGFVLLFGLGSID